MFWIRMALLKQRNSSPVAEQLRFSHTWKLRYLHDAGSTRFAERCWWHNPPEIFRLAVKKFGHPAGMKKIKLQKVKRNKIKQKLKNMGESRQCESWGCGRRGHDDVTKSWSTCVRLEDTIDILSVPPPDFEVPPPSNTCCGPFGFLRGGSSYEGPPSFASQSGICTAIRPALLWPKCLCFPRKAWGTHSDRICHVHECYLNKMVELRRVGTRFEVVDIETKALLAPAFVMLRNVPLDLTTFIELQGMQMMCYS